MNLHGTIQDYRFQLSNRPRTGDQKTVKAFFGKIVIVVVVIIVFVARIDSTLHGIGKSCITIYHDFGTVVQNKGQRVVNTYQLGFGKPGQKTSKLLVVIYHNAARLLKVRVIRK